MLTFLDETRRCPSTTLSIRLYSFVHTCFCTYLYLLTMCSKEIAVLRKCRQEEDSAEAKTSAARAKTRYQAIFVCMRADNMCGYARSRGRLWYVRMRGVRQWRSTDAGPITQGERVQEERSSPRRLWKLPKRDRAGVDVGKHSDLPRDHLGRISRRRPPCQGPLAVGARGRAVDEGGRMDWPIPRVWSTRWCSGTTTYTCLSGTCWWRWPPPTPSRASPRIGSMCRASIPPCMPRPCLWSETSGACARLRAVMVVFGSRHRTAGEDSGADRSLDRGGEADGPQGGRITPHVACRTRSRTTLSFGQCRLHQVDQPRS